MLKVAAGIDDQFGPLVDLRISLSTPRESHLKARSRHVPSPVETKALIDTGADCTIVDGDIILSLQLVPHSHGTCTLYSLDTKSEEQLPLFDVNITFISPQSASRPFPVAVASKTLGNGLPYRGTSWL